MVQIIAPRLKLAPPKESLDFLQDCATNVSRVNIDLFSGYFILHRFIRENFINCVVRKYNDLILYNSFVVS